MENWGGLTNFTEEFGFGVFADIMSGLKVAMSTSAFGMYDSFWNSLSIEMGELIDEMDVIKSDGAVFSSGHGVLVIVNGSSI